MALELQPFGKIVWEDRYGLKDETGTLVEQDIFDTFLRVAKAVSSKEKEKTLWEQAFYEIMAEGYFCPAGRILAHAGTHYSQLLNCFVLPFKDDSLESIMQTAAAIAVTQKHGGGVGISYSRLRPAGSYIKGVNGRSCGVIGFLSMNSVVSEVIEQGGCFIGDTLIATVNGAAKIKDLRKGDMVWTFGDNGYELLPCSDPWVTVKGAEVWKVETSGGLVIYATKTHPFMPAEGFDSSLKNYIKVEDFKNGTPLMSYENGYISDDPHKVLYAVFSHYEDVYNVEVEGTHNYVVCNEDMSMGVVVSNSRRGANLGLLEVWHPDIWEFISYKTEHNWDSMREFIEVKDEEQWAAFKYENLYKWQMYNVSVGVNDDFFRVLKEDGFWPLMWDGKEWELYTVVFKKKTADGYREKRFEVTADCDKTAIWKAKKKIPFPTSKDIIEVESRRKIKASEIWERLCYNAWADGCPGLLNMSTIRKYHNLEYARPIEATNPCLTGDTLVAVADGRVAVPIKQLAEEGKDVLVHCEDHDGKPVIRMMRNPRVTGHNVKVYKVTIDDGNSFRATGNHTMFLSDGGVARVSELKQGDSFCLLNQMIVSVSEMVERKPKESDLLHNPCVASVVEDGYETVYNGTVDDYHNFYFGGFVVKINGKEVRYFTKGKNCGEQPLPANSSCLLSSLILVSFVKNKAIDYVALEKAVRVAVRFMDDVIDNCEFPIKEIGEAEYSERRIGLGTMGVHDMLIALEQCYDSETGRNTVEAVLAFIRDTAYSENVQLAKEKGPFPLFDRDKYMQSEFIKTLPEKIRQDIYLYGVRCSCVLSQAPTGSIGAMYNASTGCEPWFSLSMQRNTRLGSYEDGCPAYLKWKNENPGAPTPPYFRTAQDISPEDHIKMLVLFSKYIDSAVSKTINMANSATVKDVSDAFLMAMGMGVKGITVFRDGSKEGVLVSKDKIKDTNKDTISGLTPDPVLCDDVVEQLDSRIAPKKRGNRVMGATTRVHMQHHNLYVTVNKNTNNDIIELFATVGESKKPNTHHTSGVEDSWAEGLGKIASLALRAGVNTDAIIRNLKNIPSDKPVFTTIGDCENSELIPSPPHAVARVLEEESKYSVVGADKVGGTLSGSVCAECGSTNTKKKSPSCYECADCGYSGCGG
jgi:ribonucleotide reductase alpha subunit